MSILIELSNTIAKQVEKEDEFSPVRMVGRQLMDIVGHNERAKLQLHGYHNELDGQKIPQEVKDFVEYWLHNIFQPFDVKKMEFIKEKKQKTA